MQPGSDKPNTDIYPVLNLEHDTITNVAYTFMHTHTRTHTHAHTHTRTRTNIQTLTCCHSYDMELMCVCRDEEPTCKTHIYIIQISGASYIENRGVYLFLKIFNALQLSDRKFDFRCAVRITA